MRPQKIVIMTLCGKAFVIAAAALLLAPFAAGCYASASRCGNGTCEERETCSSCPRDCGPCTDACGDHACSGTETCSSCPADCGSCGRCGDGICSMVESCSLCPEDCGTCPGCGDGVCSGSETCGTCPGDCGSCAVCGNGICESGETCGTCQWDCGYCSDCGDGICGAGEDCTTCPWDCGSCPGGSSVSFQWYIHNVQGGMSPSWGAGYLPEVCVFFQSVMDLPSPPNVQLWVETTGDNISDVVFDFTCSDGIGRTTEEWTPGYALKYAFALVDSYGTMISYSMGWETVVLAPGVNDLGTVDFIVGDYGPLEVELQWADKVSDPAFGGCTFPPSTVSIMGYLLCYGDLAGSGCPADSIYDEVDIDTGPVSCRSDLLWEIIDFGIYTFVIDGEDAMGTTLWGAECQGLMVQSHDPYSNAYACQILMTASP